MKSSKWKAMASTLALATLPWLASGCGANSTSNNVNPGVVVGALPGGGVAGTCVPITMPISFQATSINFDSANIRGGVLPVDYNLGRPSPVAVGSIALGAGTTATGGPYQRNGSDGLLSMNIGIPNTAASPYGYYGGYYPQQSYYSGPVSATGYLQISQLAQQDIMYTMGGTTTSIPCVSAMAIDMGHYNYTLYGGNVYLYLNGTDHGYKLVF